MSGSTLWKTPQKTSTHLLVWMIKPGSFAWQFRCLFENLFFSSFLKETRLYNFHCLCTSETCRRRNVNHFLKEFPELLFLQTLREIPLLHLYTTEDHSECSFRVPAGEGPPSGSCGCGGGGDSNVNRGSAQHWSPQIAETIDQMTVDKLSRVE